MHEHSSEYVEKVSLDAGFSFHPKLAEWLKQKLQLSGKEIVTVYEAGCNEKSCPIEETVLEIEQPDGETRILKIGRVKDKISKNDFVFAVNRQLGK